MDLKDMLLFFFVYSVIGWILEVINCYGWYGKIVNRGFLIGPYCPIYGCGAVLMTLLIPSSNDLISVFLKALAICTILEYITSYLMEKLFKTRWWDYTSKKFNLEGRVCLETAILFGIGGSVIIKVSNPIITDIMNSIPEVILNILLVIMIIIFVTDVIVSYNIISHFRKASKNIRKDSTEEVTKMVRQMLKENSILDKRLVNSFPDFKVVIKKYDKKLDKQIKKQKERINKAKEKLEKQKDKLKKLQKK